MKINIKQIDYRDEKRKLLWSEPMIYRRLFGVGQIIIENYLRYKVKRVAIVDGIQHLNLEKIGNKSLEAPKG